MEYVKYFLQMEANPLKNTSSFSFIQQSEQTQKWTISILIVTLRAESP